MCQIISKEYLLQETPHVVDNHPLTGRRKDGLLGGEDEDEDEDGGGGGQDKSPGIGRLRNKPSGGVRNEKEG